MKHKPIFTPFVIVSLSLAALGAVFTAISRYSQPFAEAFARTFSGAVRWLMAKITSVLPLSLGEITLIFLLPLGTIAFIIGLIIAVKRSKGQRVRTTFRWLAKLAAVAGLVYFLFAATLGVCYGRAPLEDNLGFDRHLVSAPMLTDTLERLTDGVNSLLEQNPSIKASEDGSRMPYRLGELNKLLGSAYDDLCALYPCYDKIAAPAKPVLLSEPMSYTHITGVYSFYTGEANLNVNFPDYTLPFTAAHEMSHQRGIAREDEANFSAFLVCMQSTDPYVRYSGYVMMIEYVSNALYSADSEAFNRIMYTELDHSVINEIIAYNRFFEKYRENKVAEVASQVNDSYLKSQGQQAGEKSYGMVVDLAVSYFEQTETP